MTTPASPTSPAPAGAAPSEEAARAAIRKARGALARYRVMAIVTGVMLLLLCAELILHYVFDVSWIHAVAWIPIAHGWVYVVYLVTVVDLWSKMRWRFGRLVAQVFAGVIPVTSFVIERRVHREAEAKLAALATQYGV